MIKKEHQKSNETIDENNKKRDRRKTKGRMEL